MLHVVLKKLVQFSTLRQRSNKIHLIIHLPSSFFLQSKKKKNTSPHDSVIPNHRSVTHPRSYEAIIFRIDFTNRIESNRIEFNPLERRDQETIGREGKGGRMRVRRMRPGAATHPGRESSGRSHWPLTPNHRPECDVWCCSGVLCGDVEKVCVHPSAHAPPSAPLTQFRHRRLQSQSQPAVTTPSSPGPSTPPRLLRVLQLRSE